MAVQLGVFSPHDIDSAEAIMLGYGDWYSAQLMRLIRKADPTHRNKLRLAYPDEVRFVELKFG